MATSHTKTASFERTLFIIFTGKQEENACLYCIKIHATAWHSLVIKTREGEPAKGGKNDITEKPLEKHRSCNRMAFSGYKNQRRRTGKGGENDITEKPLEKHRTGGRIEKNFRSSVSSQRNRGGHGERPRAAEEESN
jgi:hypothetical protein